MTLARSYTLSLLGLTAHKVLVEADISASLPSFVLVGLPDASLSESPARVRAACKNSGLEFPPRKITVNLSPASVPKFGSSFDLAIAVSVLAASDLIGRENLESTAHIGELALDGSLRSVRGVIPMVLAAKQEGFNRVIVPFGNEGEARLVSGIVVLACSHLTEVARYHGADVEAKVATASEAAEVIASESATECFSDIRGQQQAVQAALVAAAGGHHMSLIGSPGCGKTMIAQRLPSILPALTESQAMELAAIRSVSTGATQRTLDFNPPFVAPHHSASVAALVGGGSGVPKPGMVTRANSGVLFLDEAPEFSTNVLDSLRQPLESGEIQIARANYLVRYPAKVQLVLAANPCPCAKPFSASLAATSCECSERTKQRYLGRISGPLMDRIDIQLRMNPVRADLAFGDESKQASSQQLREQVTDARSRASHRLKDTAWLTNSQVPGAYLRKNFKIGAEGERLRQALMRGAISMRGYDKCLRLAWTLADLEARSRPTAENYAMAVWLRGAELTSGGAR